MRPTPAKPPKEFSIENAVTRALSCRTRDFSESISLNFSINFIFLCGHQVFRWNRGAGYGLKTAFITENTADTAKMVLNNWIGKKKKTIQLSNEMSDSFHLEKTIWTINRNCSGDPFFFFSYIYSIRFRFKFLPGTIETMNFVDGSSHRVNA